MAIVRIEILEGRPAGERKSLLEAVHAALTDALKVPEDDPTLRLVERSSDHCRLPPGKTERYTQIEIAMFAGRSLKAKHHLYRAIVQNLQALGIEPDDVVIVLHESPLRNWASGGVPASEQDLGFRVDV
jgi:phenylpyruvate tautomerase PptA (4-oxalocrotonate tautomerase family)